MTYQLGKKPASPLSKKAILFADVFDATKLPAVPKVFGKQKLVRQFYMYGNDEFGDCVWVAKANMQSLWSLIGGHPRDRFTTFDVLSDYAAATGFNITDPNSDQGTDMKAAAEYHRKIGIRDHLNNRWQVHSYVNLIPGNLDQLAQAAFIFGAVELGVLLTNDNMDQFDRGEVWTVTGANPVGGHCIPVVGRDADGNYLAVTWGKLARLSPSFIQKYMDEGIAYLNLKILDNAGLAAGAFDLATLQKMLAKVSRPPVRVAEVDQNIRYGMVSAPSVWPTDAQFEVAFKILRADIDKSGYGFMMSDAKLRPFSDEIAIGVVAAASPQEETPTA